MFRKSPEKKKLKKTGLLKSNKEQKQKQKEVLPDKGKASFFVREKLTDGIGISGLTSLLTITCTVNEILRIVKLKGCGMFTLSRRAGHIDHYRDSCWNDDRWRFLHGIYGVKPEKSRVLADKHPKLEYCFIFQDSRGYFMVRSVPREWKPVWYLNKSNNKRSPELRSAFAV